MTDAESTELPIDSILIENRHRQTLGDMATVLDHHNPRRTGRDGMPKITKIKGVHPYAEKFPMLPEEELAELADSVAVNGLRLPIVITPDGLILDGRNRWKACELADVEPTTEVYDGDDLAEYVIDANITRRNMTTGARAMATALVLKEAGLRNDGKFDYRATKPYGSVTSAGWPIRLAEAGVVLDYAPELARQVANGELALDRAYKLACDARDAERDKLAEQERIAAEEADAKVFIEANAPEIASLIVEGKLKSYAEGKAVWEKRNREEAARLDAEKEAERKRLELERQGRSDLYSGMAQALMTLGSYGRYDDIAQLMSEFNPAELNPPMLDRYFEVENLQAAQRFCVEVTEWRKNAG